MEDSNLYDDEIIIPGGGEIIIPHTGNYLNVISASNPFTLIYSTGSRFSADGTTEIKNVRYEQLTFKNKSASENIVRFYYGLNGEVDLNKISFSGAIATRGGTSRAHGAADVGTAAVQLLGANADRTAWIVNNNGDDTIYIGADNSVTVYNGLPVPAGGTFGDNDQGAVWAVSGTAGQDVRFYEAQ